MKKILLILSLTSLSFIVNAQGVDKSNRTKVTENINVERSTIKILRGPYETNKFFDNWFVGAAGGVNMYHGNVDTYKKLNTRISTAIDVSIGKWITPGIGFRVQYSGLDAKGYSNFKSDFSTTYIKDGYYKEKFKVSNLHADVLWNLSNAFSGYREDRTWDFIPYVGVGWARTWSGKVNQNEYATSFGLLNNIRLCDILDLTIEGRYMMSSNRLDRVRCSANNEGMTSVTVGLSFKIGKRNFKRAVTPDYASYNQRIAALESDNYSLSSKATKLSIELEECKNRVPEAKEVIVESKTLVNTTPVALFFGLGKSTLDKKELANLDFYVRNAINSNSDKTFTIIGTADNATGNAQINRVLSEKRMQYVYDILVTKYGVPPRRLVKKAEGDSNNRFDDPELNRTVIIQ